MRQFIVRTLRSDELNVNVSITPEVLHRGIFDVAVYDSKVSIKSTSVT
ncbi:MAG: hypothetical protein WDO15_00125 [Bacteroidota bacterium]